jgi:hypothetical protein
MGAGTLTTAGKNAALDDLVATTGPLYLGLLDGGTEETGAGSSGTAYARKAITFAAAAAGAKSNSAGVNFDNGGATDWGSALDEWAIYDAATSGNKVASGVLDATRNLSLANAVVAFAIGDVTITLSDS